MTSKEYAEERPDPRWQRKRLEVMNRDGFACRLCEDKGRTLNVHHAYYVKNRPCWDYPMFALETLCSKCHKDRHERFEIGEEESAQNEWESALAFFTSGNEGESSMFWDLGCAFAQLHYEGLSSGQCFQIAIDALEQARVKR